MVTFEELRRAKELGLTLTALMVKTYLEAHGACPVGQIARACMTSVRSIERAIALLKEKGLFSSSPPTKKSHDHVSQALDPKRTASGLTVASDAIDAPAPAAVSHADPLGQRLLDHEVLPWCVDLLLSKVDRAVLERQLDFHAHRLANGFRFKSHPAKYLFSACLNDYQPPTDYFQTRHREREGLPVRPEPVAMPAPAPEAPKPLTREGALTVIRMGLRSRLPHVRQEALRLAAEWDVDVDAMAS